MELTERRNADHAFDYLVDSNVNYHYNPKG
jgi:hypothetical protein